MNEDNQRHDEEELQAPAKLVEALGDLHNERIFIPPTVDGAILSEARGHLGRPARRMFHRSPLPYWAAVAASFVFVAWLVYTFVKPSSGLNGNKLLAQEDINHDGRVDILDAFSFAQRLEQNTTSDGLTDLTGDGLIDRRDVEVIAVHAVRLEKGGS